MTTSKHTLTHDNIDNHIDNWHDGDSEKSLQEYLGLSDSEYNHYVLFNLLPCDFKEKHKFAIKSIYNDYLQTNLTFSSSEDSIIFFPTEKLAEESMVLYGCVNCHVTKFNK